MGKFTNMKVQDTVNKITEGYKQTYSNPYYPFIDKGKTVVTYLSQSNELSTLDEANRKAYSDRGKLSPIKFNQINGVILYGAERIVINLQNGDFGVEADEISGECTMLPGLDPKPNDYFFIDHYENRYLFKVTDVTKGTLEIEDINIIKYRYIKNDPDGIFNNILGEFNMVVSNVGTDYKCVIEKSEYNLISSLENINHKLKEYYCDLFFKNRVETLIIEENGQFIYDPVLIEFIIRNKILTHDKFIIFTQQMYLERTFSIEYDRSIFRFIEDREKDKIDKAHIDAYLEIIHQSMSILSMRQEQYFRARYDIKNKPSYCNQISILDSDLINRIINDEIYDLPDNLENIIINYMNDRTITKSDIDILEEVEYIPTKRLFYIIPIIIHIINYNINKLIKITNKGGKLQ